MAAGTATLLRHGRTANFGRDGYTFEAVYQVLVTDKNDGPGIVALASGIPRFGDFYSLGNEFDLAATVSSVEPTQDQESPFRWEVRVVWSTINEDPTTPGVDDPTLLPNIIRWRMESYQEAIDRDRDGNLISTQNGEVFDPFPEVTKYRPVVNIERNFRVFNDTLMFSYVGAVNSDTWLGGAAEYWLCRDLIVEPKFEFGISYKRVVGEFVYNRDTWALTLAHRGTQFRSSTSTTGLTVKPDHSLVFLDSTGVIVPPALFTTISFNVYPARSFQLLGLI